MKSRESPRRPTTSGAPLNRSFRVKAGLILCGLLMAGCVAKHPKPAANRAAITNAQPAPPKPPLIATAFSWIGSLSRLLPHKAKPPQAQIPRLIGVVQTVNTEDRFVLIDATTFQAAEAGDLLVCIRDQKETANLRMSTLKNPPFLIADIAGGSPAAGDRVFKP